MSVVTEAKSTSRDGDLDGPAKAHYAQHRGSLVALCGAKLIGVPAGKNPPNMCQECVRLYVEWWP